MIKNVTCIECPQGCSLRVDIENCRVVKVEGEKCPKGKDYAFSEIENPRRVLTSAVVGRGLSLKMIPVRTDKPIPKSKLIEAMDEIKRLRLDKPLRTGEVMVRDFLGLGADLIVTRDCL